MSCARLQRVNCWWWSWMRHWCREPSCSVARWPEFCRAERSGASSQRLVLACSPSRPRHPSYLVDHRPGRDHYSTRAGALVLDVVLDSERNRSESLDIVVMEHARQHTIPRACWIGSTLRDGLRSYHGHEKVRKLAAFCCIIIVHTFPSPYYS